MHCRRVTGTVGQSGTLEVDDGYRLWLVPVSRFVERDGSSRMILWRNSFESVIPALKPGLLTSAELCATADKYLDDEGKQ